MRRLRLVVVIALGAIAACAPASSGTPAPSSGAPLTLTELRYRLIDELGVPDYCDPDSYPVGRDEIEAMRERFPEIESDVETLAGIRRRLAIPAGAGLADDQRLAIYREWKRLNAIVLDGPQRSFSLVVRVDPATGAGERVTGTIAVDGTVAVATRVSGEQVSCPICLVAGTRVATPDGSFAIEDVRPGMAVWSLDADGRRIVATVVQIGRTPVSGTHRVVSLTLADGRTVTASPGHPLGDGRTLGSLQAGDRVDGSTVVKAALEPYAAGFTYDLRASGPTGVYIADGIVLASTLAP